MNEITILKNQNEFNSITLENLEIPDYLRRTIDNNSVISISTYDYLALKFNLNIDSLLKINELTIDNAIVWIDSLHKIVECYEMWWDEPLTNISPEGEIVFEWWHQNRKLTVYVLLEETDYIKVSGEDIDDDMEDGTITSSEDIKSLWQWISCGDS